MVEFRSFGRVSLVVLVLAILPLFSGGVGAQTYDSNPPAEPVKLIFIHHSSGENWLADDNGGLGRALAENNYFVSDTNYGWGPDTIGDRTDITNWPEWFLGPDSASYVAALYSESGQNSWYTRDTIDPGGENQIIMFKSCFPNSNLEGNPDDPPSREGDWLSVGNAKAIYNELLTYFASRPDKLFIAVTAPPVQDPTFGANARAFNTWLVSEWLDGYEGSNVAVFDFYNVLTGPDTHHRFQANYIEHGWGVSNTAYYVAGGDDHPTQTGNRKATEELVPLLNVYYHLWQPDAPSAPPPEEAMAEPAPTEAPSTDVEPPIAPPPILPAGVIDDFEGGGDEWTVYDDGAGVTKLTCNPDPRDYYTGCCGLLIVYEIAAEGWAVCNLVYPAAQDWGNEEGVAVYLRAERVGQPVVIVAYQGVSADELLPFEYRMETGQEAVDGWQRVDITWDEMKQPEWVGDGTARFDPGHTMGMAFSFDGSSGSGTLWVDEISFLSVVPAAGEPSEAAESVEPEVADTFEQVEEVSGQGEEPAESVEAVPPEEEGAEGVGGGPGFCPGSTTIGFTALLGVFWTRRRVRGERS